MLSISGVGRLQVQSLPTVLGFAPCPRSVFSVPLSHMLCSVITVVLGSSHIGLLITIARPIKLAFASINDNKHDRDSNDGVKLLSRISFTQDNNRACPRHTPLVTPHYPFSYMPFPLYDQWHPAYSHRDGTPSSIEVIDHLAAKRSSHHGGPSVAYGRVSTLERDNTRHRRPQKCRGRDFGQL